MQFVVFLSEAIIPLLLFLIVGSGLLRHQKVYEDFLDGAKSGIRTVVEIMPTLIGLMVAVGVLRASGFLDFVSVCLKKLLAFINLPADLFPIAIVKMFSSSAATGLLLDLYKEHGCDSFAGNDFLYNVDLFYVREGEENEIYFGGCTDCNNRRHNSECDIGNLYVKYYAIIFKLW